ncbi:hypothetical protein VP01_559g1 [Puccinia sorghi]|uniref:Uncharacterized protein n=1 Tax=Puccinia sorghi TaxID=27349 RepID=A0A0L6UJ53_9BASI|nr:hypothetical protein VP01_559g1 [Puccinia sorghi]
MSVEAGAVLGIVITSEVGIEPESGLGNWKGTCSCSGGEMPTPKSQRLEKRCFDFLRTGMEKVSKDLSDRLGGVDREDVERQWQEAVRTEPYQSPLVKESWWEGKSFQACRDATLVSLLQEESKLRSSQATVLHLFSKKLIAPIVAQHEARQSSSTASNVLNPMGFAIGQSAQSMPRGFSVVNQQIQGIEDSIEGLLDQGCDVTHWPPIILRLAVLTLRQQVFNSPEWQGWRDVLFGQFIHIAYSQHIGQGGATGKRACSELLEEERWCASSNVMPELGSGEGWWNQLKDRLREIEDVHISPSKLSFLGEGNSSN